MLSLAFALALSATSPAHQGPTTVDASSDRAAPLVVAEESGGKTEKPAEKSGAKKPGAGVLKGKELGMMERFVPFTVNDDAVKPVKDNIVLVQIIGCFPFGGLVAPLLLYPSEGRPELASDQLVSYLVPFAATIAVAIAFSVAAWVPAFFFPPCGLIGCLGCPIGVAGWWVTNNASMNAWDRAYKGHPIAALSPKEHAGSSVAMAY